MNNILRLLSRDCKAPVYNLRKNKLLSFRNILVFSLLFFVFPSLEVNAQYHDGEEPYVVKNENYVCLIIENNPFTERRFFDLATNQFGNEAMKVYDYVLPLGLEGELELAVQGARGGSATINCLETTKNGVGGIGANTSGSVMVGYDDGEIPPGSIIRYIIGENGESSTTRLTGDDFVRGGAGGGSSAILFQEPESTSWQILLIAGAGGGGSVRCEPVETYPFIELDSQDGANGKLFYRTGSSGGNTWYGIGNGGSATQGGGGGGGVNSDGSDSYYCSGGNSFNESSNGFSGGQRGLDWLNIPISSSGPEVYNAYAWDCPAQTTATRKGGRGFTGGGSAFSKNGVESSYGGTYAGGGGGSIGGDSSNGPKGSANTGGGSYVNKDFVRDYDAYVVAGNTSTSGGITAEAYGDFAFTPDLISSQLVLTINLNQEQPIGASTQVPFSASVAYPNGDVTPDLIKKESEPFYNWTLNGEPFSVGTNYGDSLITAAFNPGDIINCTLRAIDRNACGGQVQAVASFVIPASNEIDSRSIVTLDVVGDNYICLNQVFDEYGNSTFEATATFQASSSLVGVSSDYRPIYTWYRNGQLLEGEDSSTGTLFKHINDNDEFWCEVTSNHSGTPVMSNTIVMHVRERSFGGEINGPSRPCPNSTVTYQVTGATNVESYEWEITGDASNISGSGNTRTFDIGTGDVDIVSRPIGPCGAGDTVTFNVSPSNLITTPCITPPIVVGSHEPRCIGSNDTLTLSVFGDAINGVGTEWNNYDCYLWSTGETTRSIQITSNGTYWVILDGCKSAPVTIESSEPQHPEVTIEIDNYWYQYNADPRWCSTDDQRYMIATVENYTGTNNDISYTWYKNDQIIPNQNRYALNFTAINAQSFDEIRCEIILNESCAIPAFSNAVVLPEIFKTLYPDVTVSKSTATSCSGEPVVFTAIPVDGGPNPRYSWRIDNNFLTSEAAEQELVFNNTSSVPETHAIQLVLLVDRDIPCLNNTIKIIKFNHTVYPKVESLISISSDYTAVCPETAIEYRALATNGGSSPGYQWFKNGIAVGENDPVFTDTEPEDGQIVTCELTNNDDLVCVPESVSSNSLSIKVYTPLSPDVTLTPVTICLGESTNLSAGLIIAPEDFIKSGFAGSYAGRSWIKTIGCYGSINAELTPTEVSISAEHNRGGQPNIKCDTDFSISMPEDGVVSFDWDYKIRGSYTNDLPYFAVDGIQQELPGFGYEVTQQSIKTGVHTISLKKGQVLSFRMKAITYSNGNLVNGATVTFSNLTVTTQPRIDWYSEPIGGTFLGSTDVGEDLSVTPIDFGTTYYYAEAGGTDASCGLRTAIELTAELCNQPPVAICRNIVIDADQNCQASITALDVDGGSTDPDEDLLTYSLSNAGPFGVGTHSVELTVSDGTLSDKCIVTVTVEDNAVPVVVTRDITVQLDETGNISIVPGDIDNGSSDNCALATYELDIDNFSGADIKGLLNTDNMVEVNLTVTDIHGNVDSAPAMVTVVDNIAPVISGSPTDITQVNDQKECNAVVTWTEPSAVDNWTLSGDLEWLSSHKSGEIFDSGVTSVFYTVTDEAGNSQSFEFAITVTNTIPLNTEGIQADIDPIEVNADFNLSANFNDDNLSSVVWYFSSDGDFTDGDEAEYEYQGTHSGGIASGSFNFDASQIGVYTVKVVVTDSCGEMAEAKYNYVVIYDPSGGFVTGAGKIYSPPGALLGTQLEGIAKFGFQAKYVQGKHKVNELKGKTSFQFKNGDFHLESNLYEEMSLVISGNKKATYRGSGTVNGSGSYKFMVIVIDGDAIGGDGDDKFRIKIWADGSSSDLVYDNEFNVPENAEPNTIVRVGSIVIYKPKGKDNKDKDDDKPKGKDDKDKNDDKPKGKDDKDKKDDKPKGNKGKPEKNRIIEKESLGKAIPITMQEIKPEFLKTLIVYPNPVILSSTVRFSLNEDANVDLRLYDYTGRLIETLYNGEVKAYQIYDVVFQRKLMVSGVYIVKLTSGKGRSYDKIFIVE
jgi:hypothetical protein